MHAVREQINQLLLLCDEWNKFGKNLGWKGPKWIFIVVWVPMRHGKREVDWRVGRVGELQKAAWSPRDKAENREWVVDTTR